MAVATLALAGCTSGHHVAAPPPSVSASASPPVDISAPLPPFPDSIAGTVALEETGGAGRTVFTTKPITKGHLEIDISCAHSAATVSAEIHSSAGKRLFTTHGVQCTAVIHKIDLDVDADSRGLTLTFDVPQGAEFAALVVEN
jgi:hypothetical protein